MQQKEREISRRLILEAMGDEGATREAILAATGLHVNSFYRIIAILREQKTIRICAWISRTDELTGERKPGTPFAVYGLNPECLDDAKRPKPLSKSRVNAKWQAKRRIVKRAKVLAAEGKSNMWDQLRYAA
jgi:hypothetical protein